MFSEGSHALTRGCPYKEVRCHMKVRCLDQIERIYEGLWAGAVLRAQRVMPALWEFQMPTVSSVCYAQPDGRGRMTIKEAGPWREPALPANARATSRPSLPPRAGHLQGKVSFHKSFASGTSDMFFAPKRAKEEKFARLIKDETCTLTIQGANNHDKAIDVFCHSDRVFE